MRINNKRRGKLKAAAAYLRDAYRLIDAACDEENDAYDNLPDGIQESYMGERMENAINNLEDAKDYVEEAKDAINNAIQSLSSAKE